jgi:amino acid transporter
MLVLTAITAFVVYRDIRFNARVALGFMCVETAVVTALAMTIVIVQGRLGKLDLAPFSFSSATGGFNGIAVAVIFGILSFNGYDAASVVAEETKTPRRLIPIAVILAAVTIGIFWVLTSYAYSESVPLSQLQHYIDSGFTPVTPIARLYWGAGSILITITGLTATLGIYVAVVPVTARILFAMGRDRALPRSLGTLNLRFQVPYNALTVVLVVSFVGAILMAFLQHSYFNALVWFGELAVFVALVTFIAVNVSYIFFYRRFRLWKFNLIWNLLVPIVGIGINLYILWRSFFVALLNAGFARGRSVVLFALLWCIVAFAYVVILRVRMPDLFQRQSYILPETETEGSSPTHEN